jgi:hypothetical protein
MANVKISELLVATASAVTDVMPIVQDGVTKQLSNQQLFNNVQYGNGINISDYVAQVGFGSTWYSNVVLSSQYTSAHSDSRFSSASIRVATGSGVVSNPGEADFSALNLSIKNSWMTSKIRGEIGGNYTLVRQGIKDDLSGLLIDARKVYEIDGDATVSEGGITPIEMGSYIEKTFTPGTTPTTKSLYLVKCIPAFSDGYRNQFGCWTEQQIGTGHALFAGSLYDASAGQAGTAPAVNWFLFNQSARPDLGAGDSVNKYQNFGVSGSGLRILMGTTGNRKYFDVSGNTYAIRDSTDTYNLFTLSDSGAATVSNTLGVGAGLLRLSTGYTVTQLNTLTGLGDGYLAYCTNGNAGSPTLAILSGGVWLNLVTGTAIS